MGTRLGEAALGLTALAGRRVLDVAAGVAMPVEAAASVMMRSGGSVARRTGVARRVDRLARIGRDEQRRNERMAADLLRSAWRRSVAQALADADVEAALAGVDLDAIVARVDVDAVVERVGVPELVERVLDDVDLGRIVRESSAGMAAETVDAVRWRSAGADRALNGFIDRVVLRRSPRDGSRSPP
ncbi:hypothetical protein C1I92_30155 [Jiangella anatolica]|uniref:Uncharacterized protein n=1 Tax=Jiangella anatolica TaxID=2670374 RepID=A0A2W2BU52_9ACTN|nr:hypothetical protein C1I92_30155 [Jiangella anatolica]